MQGAEGRLWGRASDPAERSLFRIERFRAMASDARRQRFEARIAAERIEHEIDVDDDGDGRVLADGALDQSDAAIRLVIESQLGPAYELHGGSAALVGQATIARDGQVTGTYWGVWVAFPIPITALAAHITVNPDCTGEITDDATGETDTIVVLENGSTIRSIGWNGFGTAVSTFYRIARADDPAPRCGPQTIRGTYVDPCRGFALDESGGVATVTVLMVWTASDGTFTGTFRQKVFGLPDSTLLESDVAGTHAVHGDCTLDTAFTLEAMPGLTVKGRGVIFDQGKRALGVPLGIYSGDTLIAPMGPLTCEPSMRLGS